MRQHTRRFAPSATLSSPLARPPGQRSGEGAESVLPALHDDDDRRLAPQQEHATSPSRDGGNERPLAARPARLARRRAATA